MDLDVGMMIAIAGVIIMPVVIVKLAKQLKKVQELKEKGGGGEKAEEK
ncbi:MAG: hypothetical protein K2X93_22370 [Candidatus Obscuribacterales bacterium]|nr:hypothetical protein [Candidatus Obscuribacterales bacterium]